MLIYPWDIVLDGPERVIDDVASRGVSRLEIATAYHSAEMIAPRRTSGVVTTAEANTCHLHLPGDTFSAVRTPPSTIAVEHPHLYEDLAERAQGAGIELTGWVVALHNSTLASARPYLAMVNCFGDAFTHGLCPANPAARTYALELLSGVAATGLFDRVMVESLSYLLYSHGHPHELWGVRMDPVSRYLLSLCFCEHCTAAAATRGIDSDAVRGGVRAELTRSWNAAHPAGRDADDGSELASLHMVWPELAAYTRMRMDIVSTLMVEAVTAVRGSGAALDVSAAVWGRPAPTNWVEGVDIAQTLRHADGFVLESYFPTAAEVAREIDHTRSVEALVGGETADLAVALTLWPSLSPSLGDFLAKVQTVADAGASRLALYNYGTASAATMDWVAEAARTMAGGAR